MVHARVIIYVDLDFISFLVVQNSLKNRIDSSSLYPRGCQGENGLSLII